MFQWTRVIEHVLFLYCFSDAIVNQVLDELGLQLVDQLSGRTLRMNE